MSVPSQPPAIAGTLVRPTVHSLAAVMTDSLRVRSKPALAADSKVLHRRLMRRDVVYVAAGPVSASCYDWYQVYVPYDPAPDRDEAFGWVAAASLEGEPWLDGGQRLWRVRHTDAHLRRARTTESANP